MDISKSISHLQDNVNYHKPTDRMRKEDKNMSRIRLLELDIENFKGISKKVITFAGSGMSIFGRNATGKSTIYDAWYWLLFGKNSLGDTKFGIKPLNEKGDVRDSGIMTTVSALVDADGEVTTLKKIYSEKWVQRRGSIDKVSEGNTTDYFIDDVPCQKYIYEAKIHELVDENVFRLLTGIYTFNTSLSWQERRKVLLRIQLEL